MDAAFLICRATPWRMDINFPGTAGQQGSGVARQFGCPVSDSKDVRLLRVGKMARLTLHDKVRVAQGVTPQVQR